MSNTVRRPRKRPRVRSYNFRTLGWLIRREAAWLILRGSPSWEDRQVSRGSFAQYRTDVLARQATRILWALPKRRYYP